jgi:pimeloyl-ACP methyl ester carboxylesterase
VPRGQLWLIAGGPGSAASDFEFYAETYFAVGQDLELYFLDHRGTGRSDRLACPTEEAPSGPAGSVIRDAEWASCLKSLEATWGDDLAGFSVTEAATDLGDVIARARQGDTPVYLYAVSYGTYLTQRYLQLFPAQANGVVLDSICSPGQCDLLLEFDRQFDRTAQEIFRYCDIDPTCSGKLSSNSWSHVTNLSAALGQGHCPQLGWTSTTLRQVLGMMVSTAGLRDYMPAVVYRAQRCTSNDIAALGVFKAFASQIDTEASSFSQALSMNITLSELSRRPLPTLDTIFQNVEGLYAAIDAGPRRASAVSVWPAFERDRYFGDFADTVVPLLMLNGTLDPQTPLAVARPTGQHYRGASQHFVEIPYSPHTTLTQSLVDTAGSTCGADLVRQFLSNPTGTLNEDCLDLVLPLNFAGIPEITQLLFGTDSPWNDFASSSDLGSSVTRNSLLQRSSWGTL